MNDLIYTLRKHPSGVLVEEISGGEAYSPKVRKLLSRQIFSENGKGIYRTIEHFPSGAPYIPGAQTRISLSDTPGMLVVASLPRTPESDLSQFSRRTALGVDTEKADRRQVLDVRERFLCEEELGLADPADVEANIRAWTAKEALLKAGMDPAADIRNSLRITKLPPEEGEGKGFIVKADGSREEMDIFSYKTDGFIITLALSPGCAKYYRKG